MNLASSSVATIAPSFATNAVELNARSSRRQGQQASTPLLNVLLVPALAAGVFCLAASPANATPVILVGAPSAANAAWDTQSNVPPSGEVTVYADQFSLSSAQLVSAIDISVFGTPSNPSTFQIALVNSLTSTAPFYSAAFNSPAAIPTTFELPINATLAAGSYFLRLETSGFVGWFTSDKNVVTTAGTVDGGIWFNRNGTGWQYDAPSSDIFSGAPGVFSVLGTTTPVPETTTWQALICGSMLLGAFMRRRTPGAMRMKPPPL